MRTACLFGVTVPTGRVTVKGMLFVWGTTTPHPRDVHANRMGWWDSLSFIYLFIWLHVFYLTN